MITSIDHLRTAKSKDPFENFAVEFGAALSGPNGLPSDPMAPSTFGQTLQNALNEVNKSKVDAEQITMDFVAGKPVDIHAMMIQVAKADVLMQLTSAVVSKTATSVNQLLQTQV